MPNLPAPADHDRLDRRDDGAARADHGRTTRYRSTAVLSPTVEGPGPLPGDRGLALRNHRERQPDEVVHVRANLVELERQPNELEHFATLAELRSHRDCVRHHNAQAHRQQRVYESVPSLLVPGKPPITVDCFDTLLALGRRELAVLLLYYQGELAVDGSAEDLRREVAMEIGVMLHGATRWPGVSAV